ncbi:MAG: peptidoglycan-binding protein, partial [Actinomycetes bacterium]
LYVPRIAEQTFPTDPARLDGLTVIATTGDRAFAARLAAVPAPQDQVSYGAQMYDCVVILALATQAAGTVDAGQVAAQVGPVTNGGRACSNVADCMALLAANEDIDFNGATGRIAIDGQGDVSTARITTLRIVEGQLQEIAAEDVDLEALRRQEVYASALFTAQVQQALRFLGLYDGEVTGVWDEATTEAVRALQRQLGLPETGVYDEATDAALRARAGDLAGGLATSVSALQQALTELGFYTGPIDGRFSAETADAVRAFQRTVGVPETGVLDLATLRALYLYVPPGGPPPVPPTVAPPVPPPATEPPTPPATVPPATVPPATEPDEPEPDGGATLYDVLARDGRFDTLVDLLRAVG